MDEGKTTVSRRAKILDMIDKEGKVYVEKLSEIFLVSHVTIRNDLLQLEHQNMLIRARGGAIKIKQGLVATELPLSDKEKENFKQKQEIGKYASKLIMNGQTIILDSGTTSTEIARNLGNLKDLTIITNALNIANHLCDNYDFNVYMPGGFLRNKSKALSGALAEDSIKNFFCDILFLGIDGFDYTYGITTPNVEEARLNQMMIQIARKVVVVCDSSKFNRRRFALIAPPANIHTIITDSRINKEDVKKIENLGIELLIT